MRCATLFLLLSYCAPLCAQDLYGFDAAERITASTFQCMQNNVDYFDFFVASLLNASTGSVDSVGVENIRRARDVGIANVQAYVTPCAGTNCPSAHQQVANALGTLRQRKLTLSQVWVDVGEWSDLSAYYPLWYARLDDRENWPCRDFVSFGGWHRFNVCQDSYDNYRGCGVRVAVGFDYWPELKPGDTTTSTLKPADTTTSTLKPADTTTSTLKTADTTTTARKADTTTTEPTTATSTTTTEPTTMTTTELTTTTKKCRLWIFC